MLTASCPMWSSRRLNRPPEGRKMSIPCCLGRGIADTLADYLLIQLLNRWRDKRKANCSLPTDGTLRSAARRNACVHSPGWLVLKMPPREKFREVSDGGRVTRLLPGGSEGSDNRA